MNKLLVCHCDLDGIGNKILAKYFNLDFDDFVIVDYDFERTENSIKNKILEAEEIYFTDFCPPQDFLNELLNLNKRIKVFDHHESSKWVKEIIKPNLIVFHDILRCGTKIFFDEHISKLYKRVPVIVHKFVELVNVYDLWKQEDLLWKKADYLNKLMYQIANWDLGLQLQYNSFITSILGKLDNDNDITFNLYEQSAIDKAVQKENEVFLKSEKILQTRTDSKGKKFGVFKASSKISIVCSRLLEKYTDFDYIICINTYKKYEYKLSCRSKEFDCTSLLKFEGHKQAAASKLDSQQELNDFWEGKLNSFGYKEV